MSINDDSEKILDQLIRNCNDLKLKLAEKSRLAESRRLNQNRRRILQTLRERCLEKFRKEVNTLRKQNSALESCSSFLNSHVSDLESCFDGAEKIVPPKFCDSRLNILLAERCRFVAKLHKECQKSELLINDLESGFQKSKQGYLESVCSAALIVSEDFRSNIEAWIDEKYEFEKNRHKMQLIDRFNENAKNDKEVSCRNNAKIRSKMYNVDRLADSIRSKHAQIVTDLAAAKNGLSSMTEDVNKVREKIKICRETSDQTKLKLLNMKNFDKTTNVKQYSTGSIFNLLLKLDLSDVDKLWNRKNQTSSILWKKNVIPIDRLETNFRPNLDSILKFSYQIRGVPFENVEIQIDHYEKIVENLRQFSEENEQRTLKNLENLLNDLRNRYSKAKCIKIFLDTDEQHSRKEIYS